MTLAIGTHLGPYEVLSALGAGGMGEVYRARDARLNRDVAVKVLPLSLAADQERLRRFTVEAQSAGALNHPNILAIYDIGTHEGLPYIVSELLEGETLRKRLEGGKLSIAKTIDYARQIASGLAAAHSRMITHRDIKPDNLFITRDGRVKILDFGLAKAREPIRGEQTQTAALETNPGAVMGTAAYMSPEQVRGEAVDHRSDIFSFGCVLYEMLAGQLAFRRNSAVETMNAILKDEPADLAPSDCALPPALDRLVRHCLEKSPDERFQSARDIAFDLETMSHASESGMTAQTAPRPLTRRWWVRAALASVVMALVAAGYFIALRRAAPPKLVFHRLTFRRGAIHAARFTEDGRNIIYSAAWENEPSRLFSVRPESPESLMLGFDRAGLFAVSSKGELALALQIDQPASFVYEGTLARAPFSGGAPRPIEERVRFADWSPDGSELAIVRGDPQGDRLEFPIGKLIYRGPSGGFLSQPRISPSGGMIAFLEHPSGNSDGYVAVVDRAGHKQVLTHLYAGDANGLTWYPDGKQVWFTAAEVGARDELRAVTLDGHERVISSQISSLVLQDISRDGAVLLTSIDTRRKVLFRGPADAAERELSWLDWTTLRDISPDGKRITFDESGEGVGPSTPSFMRDTSGAPAVKLGEGYYAMLSPDGQFVLAIDPQNEAIQIFPVGPGRPVHLPFPGYTISRALWSADGKQIFFAASQPGHASRIYRTTTAGGAPQPLSPEGVMLTLTGVSPDGRYMPGVEIATNRTLLFPTSGGAGEPLPGILPGERVANWSADGAAVFVYHPGQNNWFPIKIFRLDRKTGRRDLLREISPGDQAAASVAAVKITPDGQAYAYTVDQGLAVLHVVEGYK